MSYVSAATILGSGMPARAGELRDNEMTGCAAPAQRAPRGAAAQPKGRLPPHQAGLRAVLKGTRLKRRNTHEDSDDADSDSDGSYHGPASARYSDYGVARSLQPQGDAGRVLGVQTAMVGSGRPKAMSAPVADALARARAGQALATQLFQSRMRLHPIAYQPAVEAEALGLHGAAISPEGRQPPGVRAGPRKMPKLPADPFLSAEVEHGVQRRSAPAPAAEPAAPAAAPARRRRAPAAANDARRSRGAVVGAYMRANHCSLAEASRAVAEQGLW